MNRAFSEILYVRNFVFLAILDVKNFAFSVILDEKSLAFLVISFPAFDNLRKLNLYVLLSFVKTCDIKVWSTLKDCIGNNLKANDK